LEFKGHQCEFFVKPGERCQSVETRFIAGAGRHLCREHLKLAKRNDNEWEEAAQKCHLIDPKWRRRTLKLS